MEMKKKRKKTPNQYQSKTNTKSQRVNSMTVRTRSSKALLLPLMLLHLEVEVLEAVVAEVAKVATEDQLRSMTPTTSLLCDEDARKSKFRRKRKMIG
jgi:hypothetical protein